MLGIVVDHVASEGREAEGVELTLTAGRAMSSFAGFAHRYTMVSRDDPRRIATVTLWQSHADFERWRDSDANRAIVRPPGLWSIKPEQMFFDVIAG